MKKSLVPVVLILSACGGGGDGGTGLKKPLSDISSMEVGEVRVLNPADIQNGIDLPAGSGARDYIVIVGNTNPALDVVANYVVKGDRTAGDFGIEPSADLTAPADRPIHGLPLGRTPDQLIHRKVRSFEKSRLALRGSSTPFDVSSGISARRNSQVAFAAVPAVGDLIDLKIPDASSNDLCETFISTRARVASVSNKAILAVDTLDGPPATLFTQAVLDSITTEFDNFTFRTDSAYFGNPTDVDANGHIIVLFSGQINKLTPPGTPGSFVAGFFFAGDFFPTVDQGGGPGSFCPQSNNAEIFYLLSPDPTGRFGNVRSTGSVRQGTRGTIAHELQHMINSGRRFQNPAVNSFESTWLDEALAHVAEDAVGRAVRGFGDLETLNFNTLLPCNTPCTQANDFNAFFFQNFVRLYYWMDEPDKFSPTSSQADTSLAARGAAWALVRYAADNYSSDNPRALTRALAAGPDIGVKNFTAAVKQPIDTLVKGWLVSMYADHLGIQGLDPKYQYRTYNFRSVMPPVAAAVRNQQVSSYPLKVQSIGSGTDNLSGTNRSGSGTYYRLNVPAGAGAKNVKILNGSGSTPASFPGEHIYVLRVN